MKRFLTIVAAAATLILAASCQKDSAGDAPELDFTRQLYTVFAKGSTDVVVTVSKAPEKELNVPLTFSGTAVKGEDYTVSAEIVTIAAGTTSGSVTVTNLALGEGKTLSVAITAPSGYKLGNKFSAVISADSQEALVYSFETKTNVVLESYVATVSLVGTETGKDFKAQTDITVPISVAGEGESALSYPSSVTVKAGASSATVEFRLKDASFSGNAEASVTVNTDEAPRFIGGENDGLLLQVRGKQTPDRLVGTWKFVRTMGQTDLEEWYTESEDDLALLPTHNTGFTLTFTKEADGQVKLTPGTQGDFANYFKSSTVTLASPVNTCAGALTLGANSTKENNMFVAVDENGSAHCVYTYYKLSSVNFAFSSSSTDLKEAVVAIAVTPEGKMVLMLKQYTMEPPFGEGLFQILFEGVFDPEVMGFASLFEKQ